MILVLFIINFTTYQLKEEIKEFDSYIASKQSLIKLQDEFSLKDSEIKSIKKLIDAIPTGKEKGYIALKYVREAANLTPGISITACTITGENQLDITFSTSDSLTANSFDEELRNYFDFDRTFYNSNKTSFRLSDLVLKDDI